MFKHFFKNGISLFSSRQTNILSAAAVIMFTMLLSRLLGVLRDFLLAFHFKASPTLGVYFAAFRLPDMIFQLIVLGALSSAFIPVFSKLISEEKQEKAWELASSVINAALIFFGILCTLFFILARPLSKLIAPGLTYQEISLMASLMRIMLFSEIFLIISNFLTGALQSYERFLIPALSPLMYNLGIISGVLFLAPFLGIYGPTIGVLLGSFLHLLLQIPLARRLGFRYFLKINLKEKEVREVGKLMLPRVLGLAVAQIDPTVDVFLASFLGAPTLVIFNLALHLQNLPVGVFGFPIGMASLPTLAKEKLENFKKIFLSSFHQILYLTLPASVALIVLRIPIVRLTLGFGGRFEWEPTRATALCLALFSLSIFAQSLIHILARSFYALHDTVTPVLASLFSVAVNVILAVFFIRTRFFAPFIQNFWQVPKESLNLYLVSGLALAASCANITNAVLLLFFLNKKLCFAKVELFLPTIKTFFASLVMGASIYIPVKLLDQFILDTTRTVNLIILTGFVILLGFFVYLILSLVLKIKEVKAFWEVFKRIKNLSSFLAEEPKELTIQEVQKM